MDLKAKEAFAILKEFACREESRSVNSIFSPKYPTLSIII